MYPDRDQLKMVLETTDNSINNTLVLNTNAEFVAFPASECPSGYKYVSFLRESVYNDMYVGEKASKNEDLLDEYMEMATKEWSEYIEGERCAFPLMGPEDGGLVLDLNKGHIKLPN